jgi:hypothetical protein
MMVLRDCEKLIADYGGSLGRLTPRAMRMTLRKGCSHFTASGR